MSERYTRPDWARRIIAMGESEGGRLAGPPGNPAAIGA